VPPSNSAARWVKSRSGGMQISQLKERLLMTRFSFFLAHGPRRIIFERGIRMGAGASAGCATGRHRRGSFVR
jgi:hypothetical protein